MTTAPTVLSVVVGGVDKLHELLVRSFSQHVDGRLTIKCTNGYNADWLRSQNHGTVIYDLFSDMGTTLRAEHRYGAFAAPLSGYDAFASACAWVSWHEEWEKTMRQFRLMRAGFTFAWGPSRDVRDTLFRAEWEQCGTNNAAHPHWQVDTLLPDSDISVSKIHFGMSGWQGDGPSPQCWQAVARCDADVIQWAIRSLEYARQQINDYLPTPRAASRHD
jgi:hypothetical protein